MKHSPLVAIVLGMAIVAVVWTAPFAWAIDLSLSYNSDASDEPIDDPDGSLLMDLANFAAAEWERILGHSYSLPVTVWYEDLGGPLAIMTSFWFADGRVDRGELRVDPTFNWFFDPTPNGDEEFDMAQILYRDLTPANQINQYRGSPPETLEVSYVGTDNGSNPDVAGAHDMLSVLRHEFGHVLEMTGHNRCEDETSDDDYDFAGQLVGGFSVAVRSAEHITTDSDDRYHIAPGTSLMFPSIGTETRRGISATDAFSIVSASDWNAGDVHLTRIDFLGGNDWYTPGFWEGGQVPNSINHVSIRTQATTHSIALSGHAEAWTLLISDGNEILTGSGCNRWQGSGHR